MLVQADGCQLAEITRLIDADKVRMFVGAVFPLAAARQAYARARQTNRRGKVALRVLE